MTQPKKPFDRIVDILLWIPNCLPLREQIKVLRESDPVACQRVRQELSHQVQNPISRLSQWRKLYGQEILGDESLLNPDISYAGSRTFPNPLTATTAAYYNVAQIWTHHLWQIATGEDTKNVVKEHAASALAAAYYHQSLGISSSGTFPFILVLKVVCFLAPCESQTREAQNALLVWGRERGLEGAASSAAPLYFERRD
jgi:hypothetical protein